MWQSTFNNVELKHNYIISISVPIFRLSINWTEFTIESDSTDKNKYFSDHMHLAIPLVISKRRWLKKYIFAA